MHLSRSIRNAYVAMVACMLAGGILRFLSEETVLGIYVSAASFACYTGFVIIWLRLMDHRFLHPTALACLRAAGRLMVGWLLVRTVKYGFMVGSQHIEHYLWYAYYTFYSFIPPLLFLAVLHAGMREDEHIDRRWWLLLAVAGLISVLFLTNDLHGWAFRFEPSALDEGIPRAKLPYSQGPLFYISWLWTVLLAGGSVLASFLKSARQKTTWHWLILLLPIALGALYSVAYAINSSWGVPRFYKMPEVTCFLIVFFAECLVRLGLFPANEGYLELWEASSLRGGLMGNDGIIAFSSPGTPDVTEAQVSAALDRPLPLGPNTELSARAVRGGTAFWVRDLSHVHELRAQLESLGDVLAEENTVLQAETDLAHERESLAQRNRLHEQIAGSTASHLSAIEDLIEHVPEDEGAFLDQMHHAAVRASYAKRYANLTLSSKDGTVDARELALAMAETAEWLRTCGIDVEIPSCPFGRMPVDEALESYRRFVVDHLGGDAS